jgi:hypothetical protein
MSPNFPKEQIVELWPAFVTNCYLTLLRASEQTAPVFGGLGQSLSQIGRRVCPGVRIFGIKRRSGCDPDVAAPPLAAAKPKPDRETEVETVDKRIEAFLKDVLGLEGKNSNLVREGVYRLLEEYEKQVHDAETDPRRKAPAAQRFHKLCRDRVLEEIQQRTAFSTIGHFQTVLGVIDSPTQFLFPVE